VQVDDDVLVEVGMGVGPVGFSVEQQDLLWGMWRGGESLRTMERALAVSLPRIQRFLRQTGGIRPGPQRRREGHLAAGEREEISRGIAAGLSGRVIAGRLGRSPSTVSREIDRNGGRDAYRAVDADAAAYGRARRPKPSKLATDPVLRERVAAKLGEDWSPQQIAARLRLQHPDEPALRVSHETIYRDLYMPSRGVFDAGMFTACAVSVRSADRAARCPPTAAGASGTWSPSTPDRSKPTPARSPGTGRETVRHDVARI